MDTFTRTGLLYVSINNRLERTFTILLMKNSFKSVKARWASTPEMSELEQFYLKPHIRGDYEGKILVHYEAGFPQYFWGPKLKYL